MLTVRILLINPPHPSIGSRIPDEHLPPLGLLSIGGPLIDAGHQVRLLDAEFGPMSTEEIVSQAVTFAPEAVLLGHSGSTSGHPTVVQVTRAIREALPATRIVYGGVFPTYHWREILAEEPQIDVIVRGEGEQTIVHVIHALETDAPLDDVAGVAFRKEGEPYATAPAPIIEDLDACRVGWELVDLSRYSYWGERRAVVAQFSRGCPHQCTYCGQRPFWRRWRHRDPRKFAAELAWLYRTTGRRSGQLRRRESDRLPVRLARLSGGAHRRESPSDAGRLDPGRRHRPRRGHPAPLQESGRRAVSPGHRELRRPDPSLDSQGRHHRQGPRGDPPAAPARDSFAGYVCGRIRRGTGP